MLTDSDSIRENSAARMSKLYKAIICAGCVFLALRCSAYVVPEFVCIALELVVGGVVVVLLVALTAKEILQWKNTSRFLPIPFLICLTFLVTGFEMTPALGRHLSDWIFMRRIDSFTKIVDDFKRGRLSCTDSCIANLTPIEGANYPAHVRDIWGAHCNGDTVIVLFRIDTDVPLLHEGYMYKDYGDTSNCEISSVSPEVGWPHTRYVRHMAGHWYHFSDEPGL